MVRLTDKKFYTFVGTTIFLIIFFLAYQDVTGLQMFKTVGGYTGETFAKMSELYMEQFWTFAYVLIAAVSAMFYYFRRDISEALAIGLGSLMMLWSGLEDVIYYWMIGKPGLDQSMPWLYAHTLGWTSKYIFQEPTVTPKGLYVQLLIGTIITILVIRWLRNYNKKIGGLKI